MVGGLVDRPVIAVPTSVGYGAHFGGLAPLLAMLNSCAPGVTVVNVNNGFGAGYAAHLVNMGSRSAKRAGVAPRGTIALGTPPAREAQRARESRHEALSRRAPGGSRSGLAALPGEAPRRPRARRARS